jgi:hypothetical protein
MATVYETQTVIDKARAAFPPWTAKTALAFLKTQDKGEQSKQPRRYFAAHPMLKSNLELAWSTTDLVLPFMAEDLSALPLDKLCAALSLSFLLKLAICTPRTDEGDVHSWIVRFVREYHLAEGGDPPPRWKRVLEHSLRFEYPPHSDSAEVSGDDDDVPGFPFTAPRFSPMPMIETPPASPSWDDPPPSSRWGATRASHFFDDPSPSPTWGSPLPLPLFGAPRPSPPSIVPIPPMTPPQTPSRDENLSCPLGVASGAKVHSRKVIAVDNLKRVEQMRPTATVDNAELYAYLLLIHGLQFTQQQQFWAWLDIKTPSKAAYYEAQPTICEVLFAHAHASCAHWKSLMGPDQAVSFDGSWSQRRAALHCFGAFIDPRQKKVVDFEIVEKSQGQYKGDFVGTSQRMESEILKRMGARWNGDNVTQFCHDKDNHAMKVISDELEWTLPQEVFDINHVVKTWKILYDKLAWLTPPQTDPSKQVRRVNLLRDLETHLLRWFYVVVRTDADLEAKNQLWLGAYEHYINPPNDKSFQWERRAEPAAQEHLRAFLNGSLELVEEAQTKIWTQLNESLHAMKGKLADKNYPWKGSWRGRNAVAVLNLNEGHEWKLRLYYELHFPTLSPACEAVIVRYAAEARARSEQRRDPAFQAQVRQARQQRKAAQKQAAASAKRKGEVLHD